MVKIREPIVEGIFYPSDEKHARQLIKKLLSQAGGSQGNALAIMAPHAGYRYAGPIAASSFLAASGRKVKYIVILAPAHRDPQEEIYLPESESFRTPFGLMRVDHALLDELVECSTLFFKNDIPHLEEHCIEVQLPFVQYLFPDAVIVPILLGKVNAGTVKLLSNALQVVFAERYEETLFIISANLTSYIKGTDARQEADTLLRLIARGDSMGIIDAHAKRKISSCGAGCIATLLSFQNINWISEVISHGCSADTNFNYNELVHYAAISFHKKEEKTHGI
jgi:AmmeMemoRadiSam system protein B